MLSTSLVPAFNGADRVARDGNTTVVGTEITRVRGRPPGSGTDLTLVTCHRMMAGYSRWGISVRCQVARAGSLVWRRGGRAITAPHRHSQRWDAVTSAALVNIVLIWNVLTAPQLRGRLKNQAMPAAKHSVSSL